MTYQVIGNTLNMSPGYVYNVLYPEKKRISNIKYNVTHKKERHTYRKNHKEEIHQYNAGYHQSHIDERRFYHTEYDRTHKEVRRKHRKAHLPEHAAYEAARRALILGMTVGNLAEIKEIYHCAKEASKVRCYLCGKLIPLGHRHVDHIVPLSQGGIHRPTNLAVACDDCNWKKNNKLPEEIGLLI